jgi:hypothetical protein
MAHNSLIRFPDIAFFVSPIPIHIAAMVILYGHMSKVQCLDRQTALEDVRAALTMLPRLRWRWERKDLNGEHPLIAKLAEKVFDVNLTQERLHNTPRLIPEMIWESDSVPQSPVVQAGQNGMQQAVVHKPPHKNANQSNKNGGPPHIQTYQGHGPYHQQQQQQPPQQIFSPSPTSAHVPQQFPDIPAAWFYPSSDLPFGYVRAPGEAHANDETNAAINMVLPTGDQPQVLGSIGCEASSASFLNEERDESLQATHMNTWVQHVCKHLRMWNAS